MAQPQMASRPDGFYEVMIAGKPLLTVAKWGRGPRGPGGDGAHYWTIPGIDKLLKDDDLLEIGRRVEEKK